MSEIRANIILWLKNLRKVYNLVTCLLQSWYLHKDMQAK